MWPAKHSKEVGHVTLAKVPENSQRFSSIPSHGVYISGALLVLVLQSLLSYTHQVRNTPNATT